MLLFVLFHTRHRSPVLPLQDWPMSRAHPLFVTVVKATLSGLNNYSVSIRLRIRERWGKAGVRESFVIEHKEILTGGLHVEPGEYLLEYNYGGQNVQEYVELQDRPHTKSA